MKNIAFVAFYFISGFSSLMGQDYNFYTLDFPKPKNLMQVIMTFDCNVCEPKTSGDTSRIYYFDENDRVKQITDHSEGKIQGYMDLTYNSNNQLETLKDYGRWEYSYNEQTKDWDIATWKIETVIAIETFKYDGENLTYKEYYSGVSSMKLYDIQIEYTPDGRLKTEIKTLYPNPNVFATFDSNTSNVDRYGSDANFYKNEIAFSKKNGDTLIYKCSKNGEVTGIIKDVFNQSGQLLAHIVSNREGKTLQSQEYFYNDSGMLLRKNLTDTGVDCFGNMYDYGWADTEVFTYDVNGFLVSIETTASGKSISTQRFKYIQR